MKDNLILIGFMGAGKTSVGAACAKSMNRQLFDTDQMIEEEAGMAISDIFAKQGEEVFRRTETAVLEKLLAGTVGAIISVGGGLPLLPQNRVFLKKLGIVVFLRVQKETVLERLKGDTTRPLLQGGDAEEKVRSLLAYRNPLYEEAANLVIDVDGKTIPEIAEAIVQHMAAADVR